MYLNHKHNQSNDAIHFMTYSFNYSGKTACKW